MDVFDLVAKISLDSSEYDSGISSIKGGFSSLGSSISSSFQTAFKVGAAAITAATGAVVAFGSSAVSAGAEFDTAMSQVAATMGITNDELNKTQVTTEKFTGTLREFAQEMGSTTVFSATQCAEALNYMALAGYDAETSVNTLPNVLNLAAAGSIDLARAADMVTDAQTAFGLSTEEATIMVDQMAKASSSSNTSVEQLGDAFLTIGATAKSLSGGTKELATLMGVLADNGTKGSEAGIHLRNIMAALNGLTDEGAALMDQYTNGLYDAEGNMRPIADVLGELRTSMADMNQEQKDAIIHGIFNKTDWDTARAMIDTTAERYDELSAAIENSSGAAEKMAATQLDNLAGDITLFKSALEGAQIAVSDGITPTLREFVQFGADGLGKLTEAFKEGGLSGAMDALGELLSEGLTMVLDKVPEMIEVGVELLEALLKGLYNSTPELVDAALKIIPTFVDGIIRILPMLIMVGRNILYELANAITDNLDSIIPAVVDIMTTIAEGIIEYKILLLKTALKIITALADYMADSLPEMLDTIIGVVSYVVKILIDNLPLLLESAVRIISALAEYMSEHLPDMIPAIIDIILNIVDVLLEHLDELINASLQLIIALAEGLIDALPKLREAVPELITSIVETIVANLPQILMAALEIIIALGDGLIEALPDLILQIPIILSAIIKGLLKGIDDIKDAGMDLIGGFWEGIKKRWDKMVDDVLNLGGNLINKVKDLFDINSPSRVFKAIGEYCVEGFEEGSDELFSTDGLSAKVNASVETTDATSQDKLDTLIGMLSDYLPGLATKESFSSIGISVNKREFGRLVSEVS